MKGWARPEVRQIPVVFDRDDHTLLGHVVIGIDGNRLIVLSCTITDAESFNKTESLAHFILGQVRNSNSLPYDTAMYAMFETICTESEWAIAALMAPNLTE